MKSANLLRDAELITAGAIRERILSIRRQREVLLYRECRSDHYTAFNAKQSRIAALTKRLEALTLKLHTLR